MNERIREIRKKLRLSGEKFGEKIGLKRVAISQLETGRTTPTNQTIMSICREFNVSEEWLRSGTGDMFVPMTRDEEIATFIGGIQADVDDTFKKRLISVLAKLDENEWDLLEKIAEDIVNSKKETK
jgi:hypothetical protein